MAMATDSLGGSERNAGDGAEGDGNEVTGECSGDHSSSSSSVQVRVQEWK